MAFEVRPFLVGVGFVALGWLLFESGDTSQVCGRGACNSGNSVALSVGSVGLFLMYASSGIGAPLRRQWLRINTWFRTSRRQREAENNRYYKATNFSLVTGKSASTDKQNCDSSFKPTLIDDVTGEDLFRATDLASDAKFINIWRQQGLTDREIVAYLRKKRTEMTAAGHGKV